MAPPRPKPAPGLALTLLMMAIGNAHAVPLLVELGVFDLLAERQRTVGELAEATGTHAPALERVIALCKCLDLVSSGAGELLQLTELGTMLVRREDPSFGTAAALRGHPAYHARWSSLEATLRGAPPTATAPDVDLTALERAHVAEAHVAALADYAAGFARSETYVDVESGDPALLGAILKASARSLGVLVGSAAELARAKASLAAAGVAHRCELVLPQAELPPGDAYVISHRIEALGDEEATALLARARQAMRPNGRVLVIGPSPTAAFGRPNGLAAMMNLELLLFTASGKVRTEEELRALCTRAALEPKRVVLAQNTTRILEATR